MALAGLAALVAVTPALARDLTAIGDLQRNMPVAIQGTVDRFVDEDEFLLRDETGVVLVYVGPNRVPATLGERVTVIGVVDEDPRLEIYAQELVRADGTRVTLPHDY
jgi:uncharacterized protein YdeI (BOF family)